MRPALGCSLLLCILFGLANARLPDVGDFVLTGGDSTVDALTQWNRTLPAVCQTNDIAARAASTPATTGTTRWGPDQYDYSTVTNATVGGLQQASRAALLTLTHQTVSPSNSSSSSQLASICQVD